MASGHRDQGAVVSGPAWVFILHELIPAMKTEDQTVQGIANRYRIPDFEALQIIKLIQRDYTVSIRTIKTVKHFRICDE